MIVTLEIPASTKRKIERDSRLARRAGDAIADSLEAAAGAGADDVRERLSMGELGLTMRHPGSGLAASVTGWMIDRAAPLAAVGVPANSPAAAYAGILEYGGTIYPKNAKALSVPVSDEAKRYTSPRDMSGLQMIPRKGKPPLLVRMIKGGKEFEVHWVLLPSVTIRPFHWLWKGAARAKATMAGAAQSVLNEYAEKW